MPQHNVITDPNLHEPKGASTATQGSVYVSDGAGSGSWEKISGFGQYQDDRRTAGSPGLSLSTGVRTLLPNNGLFLIERDDPSDLVDELWDTTTNKHIPIAQNDVYDIRISWTAENYGGTSPYLVLELDIGGAPGVILSNTFPLLRSGAAQGCLFDPTVFTGSTYLINGGEFYLTYVGTGTCDIHSVSCMFTRKSRAT